MINYYNKDTSFKENDMTINYLGYYTDNGACYYYLAPGSYEETLEDVVN